MQDEQAAEDVVQETFIRIWDGKRDLITSPDIRFYLVSAVRNNCISALRKLKSSAVHYVADAPEPEPEPFFTRRQQEEEAGDRKRKMAAALDLLPPKCKEVFLLVKMHGMSYKQVSDSLGISVKTVENQMGKALRVLRESRITAAVLLAMSLFLIQQLVPVGISLLQYVLL